jgi:hypothetical protein
VNNRHCCIGRRQHRRQARHVDRLADQPTQGTGQQHFEMVAAIAAVVERLAAEQEDPRPRPPRIVQAERPAHEPAQRLADLRAGAFAEQCVDAVVVAMQLRLGDGKARQHQQEHEADRRQAAPLQEPGGEARDQQTEQRRHRRQPNSRSKRRTSSQASSGGAKLAATTSTPARRRWRA